MKQNSILLSVIVLFFLSSCSIVQKKVTVVDYEKVEKKYANKHIEKKNEKKVFMKSKENRYNKVHPTLKKELKNGIVKGIVRSVSFNKKWTYSIKGYDLSNGKVPHVVCFSTKKLFNVGDEVYVIFKNLYVKEYYLLKKANIKSKKYKYLSNKTKKPLERKKILSKKERIINKQKKEIIKGKKHQVLSVPAVESVEL